jgi:hypothetical protein
MHKVLRVLRDATAVVGSRVLISGQQCCSLFLRERSKHLLPSQGQRRQNPRSA